MAGKLRLTGKLEVVARKMLKDVCRILDENRIPYIVDLGTLLGIIREGRLLPWDNDVDLTVSEAHLERLLKIRYKFWLAGYRTRIRTTKEAIPHFPKGYIRILRIQTRFLFFKKFSLLDIFIKKKVDDKYYWTAGETNPVLYYAHQDFYENLTRVEFDGYQYSIPAKYEDYLKHLYGDWKTPVKEFNFRKDYDFIDKDSDQTE